jgi:hypothetical protein
MTLMLGSLEQVDIRAIWQHEATGFTPWLAGDGFALLADTLGIEMELLGTEQQVSEFKADIVARRTDTPDEHIVLIENQLERTDHGHLGQLLTYAAGKQAATIVWVAREFTEAHRAALDWLNSITAEAFEFYGLEIEAWRIGTSPAAPKFNMVVRPNDWSRSLKAVADGTVSDLKLLQQDYWQALRDRLLTAKSPVRPQKAQPQHWTTYRLGRSGAWMNALVNSKDKQIAAVVEMRGPPDKLWFTVLSQHKSAIEAEFGEELTWEELPGKKSSRIGLYRPDSDCQNKADWPAQHAWLQEKLERLFKVFSQRVRQLPGDVSLDEELV